MMMPDPIKIEARTFLIGSPLFDRRRHNGGNGFVPPSIYYKIMLHIIDLMIIGKPR